MGIISLACYKSYLYFFSFWSIDIVASVSKYYSTEYEKEEKYYAFEQYFLLVSYCIADLLAFILVIYTKKVMKSTKKKEIKEINQIEDNYQGYYKLIYNNKNDIYFKNNTVILIIVVCLIDFIGRATPLAYYLLFNNYTLCQEKNNTCLIHIDVIFRIILSRLILNERIHRHHCLSLIILIIGFISMIYSGFEQLKENISHWQYIIFFILRRLAFCLGDVFTKIIFIKEFILPQSIMFYKGISAFIIHILIILSGIIFFKEILFLQNNNFSLENSLDFITKILIIVFLFFRNIIILKIIYIFSPNHIGFLDIIIKYCDFIIIPNIIDLKFSEFIEIKNLIVNVIHLVSFIFIIFGTLLFTEIIIINKCSMNFNTKPRILERLRFDGLTTETEGTDSLPSDAI
jgi:hypothetical protein